MKKKLYIGLCFLGLFMGCAEFTEIDPKGKNTLNRVADLDLVLNYTYSFGCSDAQALVNDIFIPMTNVPNLVNETIKTLNGIYTTWDEKSDRVALTNSDGKYSTLYGYIGKIANPVLLNIDNASGDRVMADRLKAEALILRAWCHYLLVNFYAKAYDPATAETDPGIIYSKETDALAVPNDKLTVAQVYELIMADINAALELGSLPEQPEPMRIGLPFAYAVKAKVLMSMCDYKGAFEAAGESLKLNSVIDNYMDKIEPDDMMGFFKPVFKRMDLSCQEELFDSPTRLGMVPFTPELTADFEPGHVVLDSMFWDTRMTGGYASLGNSIYGMNIPTAMGGTNYMFYAPFGLTTVDMYLTQAECYIREGNVDDAMNLLNQIRIKRIVPSVYEEKHASTPEEAFEWLKKISRTENFATPKNFINLKRWNTEDAYKETLHRKIEWTANAEQKTFEASLAPDSPLWIFPFPANATIFNSNLTQNYETQNE